MDLGFDSESIEVRGQTNRGTSMVIVEELPSITMANIIEAMEKGTIVAKQIEL